MEQYTFKSCLMKRKNEAREQIKQLKDPDLAKIEELETFDNTNCEVIQAKLNKLLLKNFDTLPKDILSEFGVNKALNNKEAYFNFLEYLIKIEIVNENDTIEENSKKENKMKYQKTPKLIITFSKGNIRVETNSENKCENNIKDDTNTEEDLREMIEKKNYNFNKNFIPKGEITIKSLRKKMKSFFDILTFKEEHKNNILDFESELFFHYQLSNVLISFLELSDKKFNKKINMIKELNDIIYKVMFNKIKDEIILNYFYLVIDLEFELNTFTCSLLNNYKESIKEYKNAEVDTKENRLVIYYSKIKIDNFDCYDLNENDILKIKLGKVKLPLTNEFYSLKGYLLLREFTSKQGNIVYDKFMKSTLLGDIIRKLYGIKEALFNSDEVIKLFQENTYYFPIENYKYASYSDKRCFKIFIDYKIDEDKFFKDLDLNEKIIHLIKKAFFIVDILLEFGHVHQAFLYFCDSKNYNFDSPLVKLKLENDIEIQIKEGGNLFEFLLFGRQIYELNMKEIIYICNLNNFSKDLETYRRDFINLEKETLKNIFERESKNNQEISEIYEIYKKMPKELVEKLEKIYFKAGKINPNNFNFNLETYKFSCGKLRKPHYEFEKQYIKG